MNGLNQILAKIEEDNQLEVNKIKEDAQRNADKIMSDAVSSAQSEAKEILTACEKKTSQMLENAKSGCDVLIKREEISVRADIVAACIKDATAKLKLMDDEKYFEVIKKLIFRFYHACEHGELLMNERDIKRMPKKFLEGINKELKNDNALLTLSEIPSDIDSGFIISYGGVEENCTFDSLIDEKMDEIKDKLYKQLMA